VRSSLLCLGLASFLALGAGISTVRADDATKEFFNGKDLEGWEGLMQYWSVKDGAIVGYTPQDPRFNTFLCSKKKFKDFELSFKVRLKDGVGNSGVQIRSSIVDPQKFVVSGPQADMGQQYWGSLYGERFGGMMKQSPTDLVKKAVKPKDFNDYSIKCVGKHVTIKINGETMVDGDFPKMPDDGIIALQLHQGFASMEVTFKDIQFKNLTKASAPQNTARAAPSTPAEALKVMKDFKAELLYTVPKPTEGSWVNMCVDPKGRLIVSDQYGWLYRITPPPLGKPQDTKVEKLNIPLGGAHGLLYAFDSLYVMVNENVNLGGVRPKHGLHRVRSKDGGDSYEKPELLREIQGGGEHGCHAILPSPDGKSLYVICGNQTKMMDPLSGSLVPKVWGEDHLLPRMRDGNGFMAGVLGPGGCIYHIDPDGKNFELVSTGYRNPFDMAFNRFGDLFTYDADMEWDMNTPWYRPTRVCLVASGSEFGWRNGAGKWPAYYPDSLPAVYNVGPGSPTGICFGYGAKFPAKYQDALFMCDWSYGKLYAVHLTPEGSAYKGTMEEFVNGSPLPLTDVVVNPKDGALYFTVGGRRTQSGLYRITYTGSEPTDAVSGGPEPGPLNVLRRKLESYHGHADAAAVDFAWPYLGHEDRFISYAARVAIEHQDPKAWQQRALQERDPAKSLNALLALVRTTGQDPFHHPRKPGDAIPGEALKAPVVEALARLDWAKLTDAQRLDLLRVYAVLFNRLGWPDREMRARLIQRFDPDFPTNNIQINAELGQLLVYLEAPGIAGKLLQMIAHAPTQEEQLEYARSLRVLETGWAPEQRREYYTWFAKAANFKGGSSMQGFLKLMKGDTEATLTAAEKKEYGPLLAARAAAPATVAGKARPFYKKWKLDELAPIVEKGLTHRDFNRGRRLFGEAQCFACHRYDNEGGSQGPDLTVASGRFSVRDLLESIVDPSKEISDQYAAMVFVDNSGKIVTGRIVNYHGDNMQVMTNMLNPNGLVNVDQRKVESIEKSKISMMPEGLLDSFHEDEILDLVAYLLSRGDRNHKMFAKETAAAGGASAPQP
jgi:putative heme-binding domain-containing protein